MDIIIVLIGYIHSLILGISDIIIRMLLIAALYYLIRYFKRHS